MLNKIISKIDSDNQLSKEDMVFLLMLSEDNEIERLFEKAYSIKLKNVGNKVFFRGIVEFSNVCQKNCYYCGIRKSNKKVKRYWMKEDEIIKSLIWAYNNNYGSVVLQSGEQTSEYFVNFVERILIKTKEETKGELGITLSLGEQTEETYKRWFEAGAHRYLLRIETSNEEFYKKLHPADHDFRNRLESLNLLRKIGYQVGTGVMIGLPGQSLEDLVNDVIFYKQKDIDMIGMGPYIVHDDTPLAKEFPNFNKVIEDQLKLSLKMIAITRIYLQDVNIAATTALQALHTVGREMGLKAGANIIMPNITDTQYRASYQLYEHKPCLNENSVLCRNCLNNRIDNIGEAIGYKEWGDSPHFFKRTAE